MADVASTVGGDPSTSKRSSMRSSAIAKGAERTVKFANKGVKALPGSAAKGVGAAAKFGAGATSTVAKGAAKGVGNAAKVRRVTSVCVLDITTVVLSAVCGWNK